MKKYTPHLIATITSVFLIAFPKLHKKLQQDPQPKPEPESSSKEITRILQINGAGFHPYGTKENITFNGMAVFEEDIGEGVRNTSLYAFLIDPEDMVLFPKNYVEITMKGFDLNDPQTNFTGEEYYGPVNCSYLTYKDNMMYERTEKTQISGEWFKEPENVTMRNFSLDQCYFGDCESLFKPTVGQVRDITNLEVVDYSEVIFVTLPIACISLAFLVFSKDIRRKAGHSMIFVAVNTSIFIMIASNRGGKMGVNSSYYLSYTLIPIVFFSLIVGIKRLAIKIKEEEGKRQTLVPIIATIYYLAAIVFFPLTKNEETWLMAVGPLMIMIENRVLSKNRILGLSTLNLMTMVQLNWLYVYHYQYNTANIPLRWNNGAYRGYLCFIVDVVAAVVILFFTEHKKVDPRWNEIDTGRDFRDRINEISDSLIFEEKKKEKEEEAMMKSEDGGVRTDVVTVDDTKITRGTDANEINF